MKFSKENSCRSKSRNKFHQIISEEIFSTFSHNVFSAIHNDPNQKKERKQAKKFCRKSQKASRLGVVGFSNSFP